MNKLFAIGIFSLLSTSAFAAQTYPLSCRGGGGTLGLISSENAAVFYFSKTSGPAGAGLQPGQCAWVDRAIGTGEPPCLKQSNTNAVAWIFPAQRAQSYFSSSTGEHWTRSMLDGSFYQTFQAYNPGDGGCFVVTRVGI